MHRAITASIAVLLGAAAVLSATAKGPKHASGASPSTLGTMHVVAQAERAGEPRAARADAEVEGRWTLDRRTDGRMQLNLMYEENSNWGRGIDRADLAGLTEAQIDAPSSTPVAFRIQREAGVFEMEGSFRSGEGAGHFTFRPDRQFASTLRSLGVEGAEQATDRELMHLAIAGASAASLRELMALDLGRIDLEQLIQLAIFNITPEYVRSLREMGLTGTNSAESVVQLRIHNVSPEFVGELASLGFTDLGQEQLMQMGIHGVSAAQVAELRELGFTNLSAEALVGMRIHGVTPEYIREMRGAGLGELTPERLVEMRIHNITSGYVAELASLGYRDLPREQLLQMGIHGVTPQFIREVREAGFRDLPAETLVQMRIHGIGSEFVRRRGN
jgi:hypothetical protein